MAPSVVQPRAADPATAALPQAMDAWDTCFEQLEPDYRRGPEIGSWPNYLLGGDGR